MRKTLPILCVFLVFALTACFPQASQAPQVDYSPTLTAYAVEVSNLQRDLQDLETQNKALVTEKETLTSQITQLQSQVSQSAEAAARITELESQLEDAQRGLNGLEGMVAAYEEILTGKYEDEDGLMLLLSGSLRRLLWLRGPRFHAQTADPICL
jgi:Cortexillin I, coiled coil.